MSRGSGAIIPLREGYLSHYTCFILVLSQGMRAKVVNDVI